MKETHKYYRTNFITKTLIPVFVLPITFTHLFTRTYVPRIHWWILLGLDILAVIVYNAIWVRWKDAHQKREAEKLGARLIPRVEGKWPGNLDIAIHLLKASNSEYMGSQFVKLAEKYGSTTLNFRLLWMDSYVTLDENVIKYILATGFENFDKGWRQKATMEDLLGSGIFNRDGEIWRAHRSIARPFFARERIADFENFERHTAKALGVLDTIGSSPFDAQDLFSRFTLDAAGTSLFNTEFDTLSMAVPTPTPNRPPGSGAQDTTTRTTSDFGAFASAFEECKTIITERFRWSGLWPLCEWFGNRSDAPVRVIDEWLAPLIARTVHANKARDARDYEDDLESITFIEYLAAKTDDRAMIRDELLNILLAARDTTASLLTFVVYMFTQYPDILARLRAEIHETCPAGHIPTYDHVRNMKYLRAVLNETLRLYPPVAGNGRASKSHSCLIPLSSTSDFGKSTSSKPLYFPPDKHIGYGVLLLHRRKDLWGEDADTFDPDRWLDRRIELMVKNPLMFIPFHAGPRICLGQQLALNEASFFLIRLLQTYSRFELSPESQPPNTLPPKEWQSLPGRAPLEKVWIDGKLTLYVKGGLWVRVAKE